MTGRAEAEKARRVLFVNRYFFPDHSATSQMLTDLAFGLAAYGKEVIVVTSRQRYEDADARLPATERVSNVRVYRAWSTSFGRANVVGRAVDYISFYAGAGWLILRHLRRDDTVVVKTDPPLMSVVVAPIAWLRGARLVNWLQDIFPEVARSIYARTRGLSPLYRVLEWLRNRTLRSAKANVVLGHRMRERVLSLGVPPASIVTIPNWADGNLVHPVPREANNLLREWGLQGCFTVSYSGNLGRAHEYETFLEAAKILEQSEVPGTPTSTPTVRWLFIGGGAMFESFRRQVESRGLKSILFKPYQPRAQLSESLSVADVHLVSLLPELEGLIVPSKIYGIAATGRPTIFIGAADGEIATLLARGNCGMRVAPGDGQALADAVRSLAADRKSCDMLGRNARLIFDAGLDVTYAIGAWMRLLAEIDTSVGPIR